MSHFKHHVFFCTNQRAAGEACCNNHGASEMRAHAKDKVKALADTLFLSKLLMPHFMIGLYF